MKEKKDNPYVHKFTRSYFRSHGEQQEDGLPSGIKIAGIVMIACIAVPLLLMGVSLFVGLFSK
jgi:hypothetical protein